MVALTAGLLAYVLLLQPAAATFNWGAAKPFNNPTNNNNICNDQQKGGFSWKDLPSGRVNKFGDFDFSGFECKDSFSGRNGRRALQARNDFQQKVIEGKCTADKATSPKISCGSDKNFSIKEMQITVEFDTDIDFEYTMPDGSSCKQTQKCSAGGSTIPNKQCGGAKEVTFKRPQKGRDCKIGIHKVDFDCEGPPPPSTTTQSKTVSTKSSTVSTTSSTTSTSPTTSSTSKSSLARTTTTTPSKCTSCTQNSSTTTTHTSSQCTSCQSSSTSSAHTPSSQTSSSLSASSTSSPATSKTFTALPPYTNTTASQSTQPPTSTTELPKTLTATTSELPKTLTTTTPELPKTLTSTTSELPSTLPSTTSEPSKSAPSTTTAPETIPNTSEQVTTEFTFVTLTTCDVTLTQTTNNQTLTQTTQTLSTTTLTSTVTFCPKCGDSVPTKPGQPPSPPPSTSGVLPPPPVTSKTGESTTSAPSTLQTSTVQSSTSAVAPPPPPPADTPQSPCPETLPRCMNTWLSLAKCTSNSDAKCMCPNSEFTKNVITCVTAWGASEKEIQAALSYFAGICAEFVPQNPGICTDVPTSITLIPTITPTVPATSPPATSTGQVKPEGPKGDKSSQEVPCTTITLVKTVTATAGGIIQTTTQFITVPQVTFVTAEAPPAPPATAVAGGAAPPPAPAQPSIGLVPMPQPVQAGPTTAIPAGGAAPTGTTVAAAAPSGGPVAAPTGAGSAQDPKPSTFTGAAVKNGAMLSGAGLLAAIAFVL